MSAAMNPPSTCTAGQDMNVSGTYRSTRATTEALCAPLGVEDYVVQSMPDASPTKWHLAHTSWFFEQFVLGVHCRDYRPFDPNYSYLFNSYYESVGARHLRSARGVLTRPTVAETFAYRRYIDEHMNALLAKRGDEQRILDLTMLGINHEQQHQELLLTDIKHAFGSNPLLPAYRANSDESSSTSAAPGFQCYPEGVIRIGMPPGASFRFDNEMAHHAVLLQPFGLSKRLVTNGEFREFVHDGGYRHAQLWLSDGWDTAQAQRWNRPLYWSQDCESEFTLGGLRRLNPASPVTHLSYYEADAFARWAGARLPTEFEWEAAASVLPVEGNLLESGRLHPGPAAASDSMQQLFGDVWEWTASPYAPYPGFRAAAGALGEYNGKFMCNQMVLRGGSCVTPVSHIRPSYRNFFPPAASWQFSGIRLAKDLR